jgi:hypothetical protein
MAWALIVHSTGLSRVTYPDLEAIVEYRPSLERLFEVSVAGASLPAL